MSFGFGIGDISGTILLAWHLYKNCFQVARDAPHAFKSLKQELANTHSSLMILKEECANSHSTLLSAANRIDTLNGLVAQYQDVLNALSKHSKKYEKLGGENRSTLKKFWEGVKWSTEASDLDVLRNKLVYLNGVLGLILISSGNSSLQRIQSISQKVEQGVSDIKGMIKKSQATVPTISAIGNNRVFALSLSEKFIEHAESQVKWSAIGVDQWISAGTWWLLKSQASIQRRLSSSAPAVDDSFQWYTDLIKAAWILIDIISRHPQLDFLDSGTAIRVDILVEIIKDELQKVDKLGLMKPNFEQIQTCDLVIWESVGKAPALRPNGGDSRSRSGWAVEDEHIMFQQFAQYRASQHETTVPCVILLLLHKKDRRGRIMLTDQNWVARCSLPVADDMRMRIEDSVFFVDNQEIHLSAPHDAMTLHAIIEALSDYVWRCPLCDRNMDEVIALSALFAVKFGYRPVIESMPEEIPDGQDEIKNCSPKQSLPLRARQLARSTLAKNFKPELETKSIFLWALDAHQYDISTLVLEFKGILVTLNEKEMWSSLSGAVSRGHVPLVRFWLLEDRVSSSHSNSKHELAFLLSIKRGDLNVVNAFLETGILNRFGHGIEASDIPLLCATLNGHLPIVHRLLEAGAAVDVEDTIGETPLTKATRKNQLSIVSRLLEAGAEVESKSIRGDTPLIMATHDGHLPLIGILLEAGAEIEAKDSNGYTPLIKAVLNKNLSVVNRLLQAGAEVGAKDNQGETSFFKAVGRGDLPFVDRLLQAGADIDAKNNEGETSFFKAAGHNDLSFVDRLLQAGADVNTKNNKAETPLIQAAHHGYLPLVDRLLQAGAKVNAKNNEGETPLFKAVGRDDLNIVDRLLQAGADVNAKNNSAETPLIMAAHYDLPIVDRLLQAGAEVDAKDDKGDTPLIKAVRRGYLSLVNKLLHAGAEVNAKNNEGETPLLNAAFDCNLRITDRLLLAGAEVNTEFNHYQFRSFYPDRLVSPVKETLLKAGANFV